MDSDEDGFDYEDGGVDEEDLYLTEPKQILYDIVPYREWEQEPEVCKYPEKPTGAGYWPFNSAPNSPLPTLTESILAHRIPWIFAVSQDANLVAVLQDTVLEVWHSKDSYGTMVGRRGVRKDPAPSWRSLAWSEDAQLLALGFSDGAIELCDTLGSLIYQIITPQIPSSQPGFKDTIRKEACSLSYVSIFFTNTRLRDKKWMSELVLVDVGGRINSFLVSSSGYQELSSYSVGWNLTSAVFSTPHNILITAGKSPLCGKSSLVGRASHSGILAYRLVNDAPHYVSIMDESELRALNTRSFHLPFIASPPQEEIIIRMCVSENGGRLGAVHESGAISVWVLPGFILVSLTKLSEQPGFDEMNPQLLQVQNKKKIKAEFLANPFRFHPVDISWWNEESLIISRISGALSVLRMEDLDNLLGDAPEFLDGVPRISQSFEKGFFALECESAVKGRRPSTIDDSAGEDPDVELDVDSDDEDGSWISLGKRSASAVAYFMTDNERFAPPKKKSKIMRKTFRLIALVSTNPEELYGRKIDSEEYGEAIMLAQHYKLDTDPVYERQWRKSNKSVAAIHDYLSKISRRATVFNECLKTIPMDIDAARELLRYGLSGTDLESLISIENEDSGKYISCTRESLLDDWEDGLSPEEQEKRKLRKEREERMRLISRVKWQSLNPSQIALIGSRLKFLYYLDILDIYEDILGGGQFAADRFQPAHYRRMRSLTPLENCLLAARSSDSLTISAFFSGVHAKLILPHWLPILSVIPETTKASLFQDILPGLNMDGKCIPWIHVESREPDWAEQPLCSKWSGHRVEYDTSILYEEDSALQGFNSTNLTPGLISSWYEWRARKITEKASLPELGLDLLQQGLERNVRINATLVNNLRTLDALVYEVQININLETFEKMSTLEQMDCLMSRRFDLLTDIRSLLVPFLYRLGDSNQEDFYSTLSDFCLDQARTDLSISVAVIENSGPWCQGPILQVPRDIVKLALESCYSHQSGAQMEFIDRISRCIEEYYEVAPGRPRLDFIQDHKLDREIFKNFMQHLEISKILSKNGVSRPLSLFKTSKSDREVMQKVFEAVTCQAEAVKPSLDQDGWRTVLRDLQRLQKLIPVVPIQRVFYMFCESLLSSGSPANIDLAGDVLQSMMEPEDQVSLIITAWTHYFSTSSNLNDPNIELAKHCLCLIKSSAKEIIDCGDLISSLQSLADFGLPHIHPVTVLNAKNRLDFVVQALNAKPHAYKNSQRLMKLATLLKAESIDKLEGLVWTLVARKALEVGDFNACQTACNNIIQGGYTPGWDVCFALGVKAELSDLQKSLDLLSFSVTHCDPGNIENVVLSLLKVEQKLLHSTISAKAETTGEDVFTDVEDESEDKFEDTVEDINPRSRSPFPYVNDVKNTLFNVTRLSTSYLVDHEISRSVLASTTSLIQNIARKQTQDSYVDVDMTSFDSFRFPAFYSSLFMDNADVNESLVDFNFRKYSLPRIENSLSVASQQGLRSQLLSGVLLDLFSNTEPTERVVPEELLKELIPVIAGQDIFQGLGLMVSLVEETNRKPLLLSLPQTVPSLNFILTYLAIVINKKMGINQEQIFQTTPTNLLKNAIKGAEEKADIEPDLKLLHEVLELAVDYNQANILGQAGDVDIQRFTKDHQYQEDTILGLARFLEPENWEFTCTLAKRYKVDTWILAATHTEAIFVESEDTKYIRNILEKRDLCKTLQLNPTRWRDWSTERIFPLLDGTNQDKLILYFHLMHDVTKDEKYLSDKEALSLLGAGRVNIDYIRLVNGDLSVLDPLDSSSMEVVAKAVEKLPEMEGRNLTSSKIYLVFAEKEFFRRRTEYDNWIESFSNIQDTLEKLDPESFKIFMTTVLLSEKSLSVINRGSRSRIMKKSIKFIEIKIAEKAVGDWTGVLTWAQKLKSHLDKLTSKLTEGILGSLEPGDMDAVNRFELTGGESSKILNFLVNLVHTGAEQSLIMKLIAIWKQDEMVVDEGFAQIFSFSVESLKSGSDISHNLTLCIQRMLDEFEVCPANLRNVLTPLCTLETISVSDRLMFVQILKKTETAEEREDEFDSSFLSELYQVQEKVQSIVPDFKVLEQDIGSDEDKIKLFSRLIEKCGTCKQLRELSEYFLEYFSEDKPNCRKCLLNLLNKGLDLNLGTIPSLNLILQVADYLTDEEIQTILSTCAGTKEELYIMLILKLKKKERYNEICKMVTKLESVEDETLVGLVEEGLGAELATSALYPRLVEAALGAELGSDLVSQLTQAGQTPLALALQLLSSGVPGALRTMASFRFLNPK